MFVGKDVAQALGYSNTRDALNKHVDAEDKLAEASMQIGPEPEWTQEAADAGTLKYPSAGIAMSFLPDSKQGVDLQALGVKKLRIDIKASGPIRMAVLNGKSVEAGSEPGVYVTNSSDYKVIEYDMTPEDYGFKGFTEKGNNGGLLDWVDMNSAPEGSQIIKEVRGLKFEVKQKEGGIGDVSIRAIEFLDASGNVIDPVSITGMPGVRSEIAQTTPTSSDNPAGSSSSGDVTNPNSSSSGGIVGPGLSSGDALATVYAPARFNASVNGLQIQISNASVGSNFAVFSMQGKVIKTGMIKGSSQLVTVQNKGAYVIRVGNEVRSVIVK